MRPIRGGLFRVDPPALLGSRCQRCGRHAFPRATTCPLCGAESPVEVELSASGTLWGWTAVTAAPPGYRGEVPFGFGVVELPEGVRVISRLAYPVVAYQFGQPMHLRVVELRFDGDDHVLTWEFAPV